MSAGIVLLGFLNVALSCAIVVFIAFVILQVLTWMGISLSADVVKWGKTNLPDHHRVMVAVTARHGATNWPTSIEMTLWHYELNAHPARPSAGLLHS